MKIIAELMQALIMRQEAQAEVERLRAELTRRIDGRGKSPRKPRRKLRSWQKKSPADKAAK